MAIEPQAVGLLTENIFKAIRQHYEATPMNRDRVYEVLNALGAVVAVTLAPAAEHGQLASARAFFESAIDIALPDAIEGSRQVTIHDGGTSAH